MREDGERPRQLDVGGGYGFFGSALTRLRPDVETCVLEPSASRAETGRRHFAERSDPKFPSPAFEVGLLDEAFVAHSRGRYDVVTLWHVPEHVEDPFALLRPGDSL